MVQLKVTPLWWQVNKIPDDPSMTDCSIYTEYLLHVVFRVVYMYIYIYGAKHRSMFFVVPPIMYSNALKRHPPNLQFPKCGAWKCEIWKCTDLLTIFFGGGVCVGGSIDRIASRDAEFEARSRYREKSSFT